MDEIVLLKHRVRSLEAVAARVTRIEADSLKMQAAHRTLLEEQSRLNLQLTAEILDLKRRIAKLDAVE